MDPDTRHHLLSTAIAEGRITPARRQHWERMLKAKDSNANWLRVLQSIRETPGRQTLHAAAQGSRPVTTASGLDASILAQVPWQAQRAVARAETASEAHRLVQRYSGPVGDDLARIDAGHGGPLSIDVADIELEAGTIDERSWEQRSADFGSENAQRMQQRDEANLARMEAERAARSARGEMG